jgi:hypothetical protein
MGVSDVLEVQRPVFMGLIGQLLRFAGDGVDLTACAADLLDDSLCDVAP